MSKACVGEVLFHARPRRLPHTNDRRMRRLLFVCSRNRLRSPTAAQVFASWPGIETDSAGLATDAETVLSADQVDWADVIFVMEKAQQAKLAQRFKKHLNGKKVVCLDIPDDYEFMQAELVAFLEKKVRRLLL